MNIIQHKKSMWTFKYLQPWTSQLWQIQHSFSEALTVCIICHWTFVIALSLPIIFCKDLDSMTKLRQDSTSSNTEVWGLVRMTRLISISLCVCMCVLRLVAALGSGILLHHQRSSQSLERCVIKRTTAHNGGLVWGCACLRAWVRMRETYMCGRRCGNQTGHKDVYVQCLLGNC